MSTISRNAAKRLDMTIHLFFVELHCLFQDWLHVSMDDA